MKKFIIIAAALAASVVCFGQQPLPNDPDVRTGKLDNGMTYYIRHNDKPAQRAEFYLATDVGAIQEGEGQDGLAHFLEHMCFNGLKNLPGKMMLDYLQNIGAEFGRNINASTGVEQTQYMLNNIPVIREGIIDTCLLVMHDYSHFVLNEPEEIDAERGVILEEKRTRNNASWRMFEQALPYYYGDCKYATCNVIGSEQTLKTFTPETIKNYYETWYRPDMQALIVVGDIDVDQIYDKIVKLFADIPAPEQPTVKEHIEIPLNEEPVVGILTDPENSRTSVEFIYKTGEPTPKALKGTDIGFFEDILKNIVGGVMYERFNDIAAKADAPFIGAQLGIGDICAYCEAVQGSLVCDNSKTLEAVRTFLTEFEKAKRFGFTDDEVNRVKEDIIKSAKDAVAGEATRKNAEFIYPIMNNFFHGYSYMAPQTELQVTEALCSQISAALINQMLPQILTGEHLTILYTGVDKEGQVHPTEEQLLAIVDEVKNSEIEANAAEQIDKNFMAGRTLIAGKVKKAEQGLYGSTVWTLKNGLKVVVLPTEYKKDQVLFRLVKDGGMTLIPTEDLASFDSNVMSVFNNNSGVSKFSSTTVSKMLSGKNLRVSSFINGITNGISGSCSPEDLETALQIAHLTFIEPRFDPEEWNVGINQLNAILPGLVTTPDYVFQQHLYKDFYNSPRQEMISMETVEKASLDTYAKYYKQLFNNIAGATLYIVGNVDLNTLQPLVEAYCGSLPKAKKANVINMENTIPFADGAIKDEFKTAMTTPKVTVYQLYTGKCDYSVQKSVNLQAASFILDMIYTTTLREEEGGTYGASSAMDCNYRPHQQARIITGFDTNTEQQQTLRDLATKGLMTLAYEGPTEEQLNRAIENAKKNVPENRISNSYWMSTLIENNERGTDYDAEYEAAVNNISAEGIKSVLQEIIGQNNFKEIVMFPQE